MSGIGEIILSAALPILIQKLTDGAITAFAARENVKSEVKKLAVMLNDINTVLIDAEQKQLKNDSLKSWLNDLRDIAYDLDDILDEIKAQDLIQSQKEKPHSSRKRDKLMKLIHTCSRFSPAAISSDNRMMTKINEITASLDKIKERKNTLIELTAGVSGNQNQTSIERDTCAVLETDVFGRDVERNKVIEMLLEKKDDDVKPSVIAIVGDGGIGKTTLAKQIFHDEKVKKSFETRSWACVSQAVDQTSVIGKIYTAVTNGAERSNMDLATLKEKLAEKLENKKFLVILDDVWIEDVNLWDLLTTPLQSKKSGSRILVTTRSEIVASIVNSTYRHRIGEFSDEDCWQLMLKKVGLSKPNPDLRDVGMELAKKCCGLPLVAKVLGGALRTQEASIEGWTKFLHEKLVNVKNDKVLPILQLSYSCLSSHLKPMFAYCSIFPKNYKFLRGELVQLWIAQEFLKSGQRKFGFDCFDELLLRSFFQPTGESLLLDPNFHVYEPIFVMHDLVNDLAREASGGLCFHLDKKMTPENSLAVKTARHSSFQQSKCVLYSEFNSFQQATKLRTFLSCSMDRDDDYNFISYLVLTKLLPELHGLRVLSLNGYQIRELPSSIGKLIHLRYLDLSSTQLVTLPDSIGELVLLESLSLRHCSKLEKLPPALGNLPNLIHIDNSGTNQLVGIPIQLEKLKCLQTLKEVRLLQEGGFQLEELGALNELGGGLSIFELQNAIKAQQCLKNKAELQCLQLCWGTYNREDINFQEDKDVLESLQPHHENLRELKIHGYRGSKFTRWIGDASYRKLSDITISDFSKCSHLPPLGNLENLKSLRISSLKKLSSIEVEFYGRDKDNAFSKLEEFALHDCPELTKWTCPCILNLQKLSIKSCRKLAKVSSLTLPSLRDFTIIGCDKALLEVVRPKSLTSFHVESISGVCQLPPSLVQSFSSIHKLGFMHCSELESLWSDDIPPEQLPCNLQSLRIKDCCSLVTLPNGLSFSSSGKLELDGCVSLESLPGYLSATVGDIHISECHKVASILFPETNIPHAVKSLQIENCESLESLTVLSSMEILKIKNCNMFRTITFPDDAVAPTLDFKVECCASLVSLPMELSTVQHLSLTDCESLVSWGVENSRSTLRGLTILRCGSFDPALDDKSLLLLENLVLSRCNYFPHLPKFQELKSLRLWYCNSIQKLEELPLGLKQLRISNCEELQIMSISSAESLDFLEVNFCKRLVGFPSSNFPKSLSSLGVVYCDRVKPLSQWGLDQLSNLRAFHIQGCLHDVSQLDCSFPTSLTTLSIYNLPKLISFGNSLQKLSSLQYLYIFSCAEMSNLEDVRCTLENLQEIEIISCPRLSDKADYLEKTVGIPRVEISQN